MKTTYDWQAVIVVIGLALGALIALLAALADLVQAALTHR